MSDKKEAEKESGKEDSKTDAKASAGVSKKLLFMVAGGMLLLMVVSIGATVFIMGSLQDDVTLEKVVAQKPEVHDDKEKEEKETESKESDGEEGSENKTSVIIYIPIAPEFVVNFHGDDRQHFLQMEMSVSTLDAGLDINMKAHMPLIRNSMVMLLGAQSYESLKTVEGKNALRQKALESVQEILKKEIGNKGVEEIYFTEFVMQ